MAAIKNSNFNKTTILFVLLFVLLFFGACRKSSNYKWLNYDETFCADAWSASNNNETLKQNVVEFMKTKDITVYDSEIFVAKDAEPSTTCSNKTGRIIKCKIKEGKAFDIKAFGFYE
ncbi:MAG: hypothetical protein WCR21_03515 [Bacteroidota bacterium]